MANRIMVVDDAKDIRRTLQVILTDEGHNVIIAENGFQAIEMASEEPIDLIFMDIRMPGMDGVDAFLQIKEILPDCVVVMMTGYAMESLIEKALSEGAKTCLRKPVSIEQLLEITKEVLPKSSIARRIMVVDDAEDIRDTLQVILTDEGRDVIPSKMDFRQ